MLKKNETVILTNFPAYQGWNFKVVGFKYEPGLKATLVKVFNPVVGYVKDFKKYVRRKQNQ